MNAVNEEGIALRLCNAMEGVENEEYILGGPLTGQAFCSSSQNAEEEESKTEIPVLKTESSEVKEALKDMIMQVKTEKEVCHLPTNLIKEEPVDKNDTSFITELRKLAHDVQDSKFESYHHSRLLKQEPILEIASQHKQTVELNDKEQEFCLTSVFMNGATSGANIEKNTTGKGSETPANTTEELMYDSDDNKTLSKSLHSYKQIEKGHQMCEMLFSHIPVADNSLCEEIYVSKVSECKESTKPQNPTTNQVQPLSESVNKRKLANCDIPTSYQQSLNICKTSPENNNSCEKTLLRTNINEEQVNELLNNTSHQSQTSENNNLHPNSSCSVQTKHSHSEIHSRFTPPISSTRPTPNSAGEPTTVPHTNIEAVQDTDNNYCVQTLKGLDYSRKRKAVLTKNAILNFKCSHCDKAFKDKSTLNRHKNIHGNKKFVCFICCKAYTQKTTLNEHKKLNHSGKKSAKLRCSVCRKAFINNKCLMRHLRDAHKTGRSVVDLQTTCDVCQKIFQSRKHMKAHRRFQHNPEAEFVCGECSKVFNNKPKLTAHVKMKHLPPTYKCKKCFELFNTLQQRNSHLHQKHGVVPTKRFVCDKCGISFNMKHNLQAHIATHSEENRFFCDVCGKGFKRDMNRRQHMHSHSDTGRFSCACCEKSFKYKHHLKQHMSVHGMVSTPKYGKRSKRDTEQLSDPNNTDSNTDN